MMILAGTSQAAHLRVTLRKSAQSWTEGTEQPADARDRRRKIEAVFVRRAVVDVQRRRMMTVISLLPWQGIFSACKPKCENGMKISPPILKMDSNKLERDRAVYGRAKDDS
jgi:hypothetical protein